MAYMTPEYALFLLTIMRGVVQWEIQQAEKGRSLTGRQRTRSRSPARRSRHDERDRSRSPSRDRYRSDRRNRSPANGNYESRGGHSSNVDSTRAQPARSTEERQQHKEQMMSSLRETSQQDRRVYVGNLSYDVKWHHLKDHMRKGTLSGQSFTFGNAKR